MKDYLTIEKGISEIINKLNKLKKTAKEVCIKFAVTRKRGKITKNKNKNMFKIKNTMKNTMNTMKNTNLNSSKGSQYNSYKSLKSASASNLNDSSVESPIENEPVSVENESVSVDNEVVSVEPTPVKI
jgi:hypothetical protein